ncbi:MAG: hypothetical protein SH807_03190 [Blastochloris sp.]|jgi:hypothetical protein|nr:hypothetical protein [Blastochloris sp.]
MKFLKFILAILLLPALYSVARFGWFMLQSSYHATLPWTEIVTFSLGFSTCVFAYLSLPRGNWFYVLGHETTHAVAVLVSGGKVSGFKISSQGGHVVTDRISAWIALSPYFIPFYPIVVGLTWSLTLFFKPELSSYDWAFLLIWGISWGFHTCHTLSLLKTAQPDFESQGFFFSYVVIALMNLLAIELLIWCWQQPLPALNTLQVLGQYLYADYFYLLQLVKR